MRSVEFNADQFVGGIEALNTGLPRNGQLDAGEAIWLEANFAAYLAGGGRGDLVPPDPHWDNDRGAALITAYDQTHKDGRLENLRGQLKRLMANRCPSCGGARPGELDHHLPKSEYQEFSLFPANLVACCGSCNRTKRADVGGVAEEAFLHPYFDAVPAIPYVHVTLHVGHRHVRATLAFDENAAIADDQVKARMRHQFDRIDVNLQLESEVEELIGEVSAEFRKADPLRVFHITAIPNLRRIANSGALLSKNRLIAAGLAHENIAYENIQDRRARTPVPVGARGMLHDYVPFHFAPRQPMLMAIHYGKVPDCTVKQDDIVHLVFRADKIAEDGLPFAFATHHPVTALADFYDTLDEIGEIDWDMFFDEPQIGGFAKYFHNPPEKPQYATRKETRQAEFLVHDELPIDYLKGIGVFSDGKKAEVETLLDQIGLNTKVKVKREWYI